MADGDPAWLTLSAIGLPILTAAGVILDKFGLFGRNRLDAKAQQEAADLEMRKQLSAEASAMIDRHRAEAQDLRTRLAEVERDRDRGWDLARWWRRMALNLYDLLAAAVQIIRSSISLGRPPTREPEMPAELPGLEDPET